MKHRLLSLLGLARRAGKLEAGFDAAKSAVRAGGPLPQDLEEPAL